MTTPLEWIGTALVFAIDREQIAEHGGPPRLRDEGLLQSALHLPRDLFTCGQPDLATLVAAYAVGLARNHPCPSSTAADDLRQPLPTHASLDRV